MRARSPRGSPRAPRPAGAEEGDARRAAPTVSPKALAVRYLARRDYSRAELATRLLRQGVAEDVLERTLDELAAAGYLSDTRYAQAVVAHRTGRFGKRAIVYALKERGVAQADVDQAVAPLAERDELEDAFALWQRRFGVAPADDREKARHARFLQSRGYGLSTALAVLKRAARGDTGEE